MSTEKSYDEETVKRKLETSLPAWRYEGGWIVRQFRTSGWKASLMVANAIGHLAEAAWHHPDLLVSYSSVTVRLMTHSAAGITDKDLELARKIEDWIGWQPGKESSVLEGTPNADPRFQYIKYEP